MKKIHILFLPFLLHTSLADNIAPSGTGIIGIHTVIDSTLGTPYVRPDQPDGTTIRMTDGTYGTDGSFDAVVDTWNGDPAATGTFAYYGVTGLTVPAGQEITHLTVNLITANDGGWFGPNGTGPGNGAALNPVYLTVPTIQVTANGGATWANIGATTNTYLSALDGHFVGQPGDASGPTYATVTFDFDTPQTEIDGIRLIGPEGGGPAGTDEGGFIGLAEFEVNTTINPTGNLDGDGMPDSWEALHGVDDPNEDFDTDGLTNLEEYQNSTLPKIADSDTDGLNDGDEVNIHFTKPNVSDSDGDRLSDGDEVITHMTDPNAKDSDLDGLEDGEEINTYMTDPNLIDSDVDGYGDASEVAEGSDPNDPASIPAANVALSATGIAGNHNKPDDLTTLGIQYTHHGNGVTTGGTTSRLTDGVTEAITLETTVDTWHGGAPDTHSYAGVIWDINAPPSDSVNSITLTIATFVDGGWFGVNGISPIANGALELDTHISADSLPAVQVTTDGGSTWSTVSSTTDYLSVMTGHLIGNPPTTNTATWTIDSPQAGIDGIRVIGTHGGNAGDAFNGFIGVTEVAVTTGGIASIEITDISYSPPPVGNGNGSVSMTWNSSAGKSYSIYRSSDLTPLSWVDVDDAVPSGGVSTSFTFENPVPGAEKQFFRISQN